jgi:hypothetical protein
MGWIGDKFMDAFYGFALSRERKAFLKQRKIGVVSLFDEDPAFIESKQRIDDIVREGRLEDFSQLNIAAMREGSILTNAIPLHALQRAYLRARLGIDESVEQGKAAIVMAQAAYNRAPSAETAAQLSVVHTALAQLYRGYEYLGEDGTTGDWESMQKHVTIAQEVLARHAADGQGSARWLRQHYYHAINESCSREEFDARFEVAWALDRYDTSLIESHSIFLLPRWIGHDEQDVEVFARRVMELTRDRFGLGGYAWAYDVHATIGDHEAQDTRVDRALLIDAYEDLTQRFPAASVVNRYARTMMWFEDDEGELAAYRLFSERMRAIVPEVWNGETRDEQISDALDSLDLAMMAAEDLESD